MKKKIRATLDTNILIRIIDEGDDSPYWPILDQHDLGNIEIAVSSRVWDPDTGAMWEAQQAQLDKIIEDHQILIIGAPMRLNISRLGGRDLLGGPEWKRSPDEVVKFRQIVGMGPKTVPPSKKLANEIGDYDALHCHFTEGRDVFVTLDKKGYFALGKREIYKRDLGLVIQSPEELIATL